MKSGEKCKVLESVLGRNKLLRETTTRQGKGWSRAPSL